MFVLSSRFSDMYWTMSLLCIPGGICTSLHVRGCVGLSVCVCMCVRVHGYVHVYVCAHVCICRAYVYMCVQMCVCGLCKCNVCVCCACMCVVHIYKCMCVCIRNCSFEFSKAIPMQFETVKLILMLASPMATLYSRE